MYKNGNHSKIKKFQMNNSFVILTCLVVASNIYASAPVGANSSNALLQASKLSLEKKNQEEIEPLGKDKAKAESETDKQLNDERKKKEIEEKARRESIAYLRYARERIEHLYAEREANTRRNGSAVWNATWNGSLEDTHSWSDAGSSF